MGYKLKFLFIYSEDDELNNLLTHFPFNTKTLSKTDTCIKYDHFDLFVLKALNKNNYLEFREIIGMMVVKVLLSKTVNEYIMNNEPDIIKDIFEPMVSRCSLIGSTKVEVIRLYNNDFQL